MDVAKAPSQPMIFYNWGCDLLYGAKRGLVTITDHMPLEHEIKQQTNESDQGMRE